MKLKHGLHLAYCTNIHRGESWEETFDALQKYALKFAADPSAWHFLTGSETAIRHVCSLFGEDYFPDEGLMDHSLHTAIIDREGRIRKKILGQAHRADIEAVIKPLLDEAPATASSK